MATSSNAVRETYYWALDRIKTLTKDVKVKNNHYDFRCVEDATAISQEFEEWLEAKDRNNADDVDVIFLEYIGQGSEYD
tara:strand:- start:49 stop:285 length:237 start_codon:yes stop_codon:yes gene_type:complete